MKSKKSKAKHFVLIDNKYVIQKASYFGYVESKVGYE